MRRAKPSSSSAPPTPTGSWSSRRRSAASQPSARSRRRSRSMRSRRCRRRSRSPASSFRWDSCGGSIPATPPQRSRSMAGGSARRWSSNRHRAIRSGRASSTRTPGAAGACGLKGASTLSRGRGAMLIDMGIHDFDLARWFMGDVKTVATIGATIAYPELMTVGDIDNAVASLTFTSGKIGVVDLSRSGIYGYDIATEILGLEGTLKIGYLRETPVMLLTKNSVAHDTVPYFMERFRDAYTTQLQNFAQNVLQDRPAPITIDDGLEALRIGVAATRAHEMQKPVVVADIQ